MSTSNGPLPEPLLVACLCAQWCGICRDYAPLMERVLAEFNSLDVRVTWVDIEDNEALLGDLDVQSFPTLLMARGQAPLFFGTITPHAHTLQRLVQSALNGDLPHPPGDAELQALVANVQAFQADAG
jgi:thiol-disulfide isomerase/thioredoxin